MSVILSLSFNSSISSLFNIFSSGTRICFDILTCNESILNNWINILLELSYKSNKLSKSSILLTLSLIIKTTSSLSEITSFSIISSIKFLILEVLILVRIYFTIIFFCFPSIHSISIILGSKEVFLLTFFIFISNSDKLKFLYLSTV